MMARILLNRLLILVGVMGTIIPILIVSILVFDRSFSMSETTTRGTIQVPKNLIIIREKNNIGVPVRLKIPAINVDAIVENVGVTQNGEMGVPKSPDELAWFELGPKPGEKGSSVISGHYGWKNNIPAVFDNLHKLVKGDSVYVEDSEGKTVNFTVREVRSYDQNASAEDVFGSSDGDSHLNLITCEGVWNKEEKSYSSRLVVFADMN